MRVSPSEIKGRIVDGKVIPLGAYKKSETYSKTEIDEMLIGMAEATTNDIDTIFEDHTVDLSKAEIASEDEIDEMFE